MLRVLTVDDSSLSRMILKNVLEADGDIKVIAEASNGFEAVPRIQEHRPDVVTMDIDMPGRNGLETIEQVMKTCRVPILVVTSERLGPDSDIGFRAIQVGALDFTSKPSVADEGTMTRLRANVRALAGVPVPDPTESVRRRQAPSLPDVPPFSIIAIAAGTGGSKSVATILRLLPENFGAPIVLIQQMPPNFASAFVKYLQGVTPLRVSLVEPMPRDILPGEILVANTDAHAYMPMRGVVVGIAGDPVAGQRPSATVLYRSIAEAYGGDAVGILLSGSGEDGVEGLAAMRSAGAMTIAESEASAALVTTPNLALQKGAAVRALPAQMIASCLASAMTEMSSKTTAPPSSKEVLTPPQS